MNGIDAIKTALDRTRFALNWYVSDLSDADLLVRPVAAFSEKTSRRAA